jgi:ASCH domain
MSCFEPKEVVPVLRRPSYALSLKQPWAALLVSGQKTIEIRKWATAIRGRVQIHAARISDNRPDGWKLVTDELQPLAQLTGGIIGSAELFGCLLYRTPAGFVSDAAKHFNPPDWFEPPKMYGFQFRGAAPVPFFGCKGNVRFFRVDVPEAG